MTIRITENYVYDGFMHRPFDPERDGWLDEQLHESEVPSVKMARDILLLFNEVNDLRRENWRLRQRDNLYDKSFLKT